MTESVPDPKTLEDIERRLREGANEEVERGCRALLETIPEHPQALHLLGLARARQGAAEEGERHLRRSIALEPGNTLFRFNLASFLRRAGRLAEAEQELREVLARRPSARKAREQLALTLDELGRSLEAELECRPLLESAPPDADAFIAYGQILAHLGRLPEAELAYRRALELAPQNAGALRQLGALLNRLERAEEALTCFERASAASALATADIAAGRGRALMLLGRLDEAEEALARSVAERPRYLEAQLHLARLRYLRGDPFCTRTLEAATRSAPSDLQLESMLINIWLRSGRFDRAERRARELLTQREPLPPLRSLLAQALLESGRAREAESEALEAVTSLPRDDRANETLVAALLARGRVHDALPFVKTRREQEPTLQQWIAYETLVSRLLDPARYRETWKYAHLVRAYRVDPPVGWTSIEALNVALRETLRTRLVFKAPPLDHPVRAGVRTERNLATDPDPVLIATLKSFERPVEHYLQQIGREPGHPYLMHNTGAVRLGDAWAVRLDAQGEVRNHVHAHGWLSGTYFVSVSAESADDAHRTGWLKFGEPRHPVPGVGPDFMVRPSEGLLVLYPSCLWHGTTPLTGDGPRVTLSFESLPIALPAVTGFAPASGG
jgi:Flp pilus assembly protein TadD